MIYKKVLLSSLALLTVANSFGEEHKINFANTIKSTTVAPDISYLIFSVDSNENIYLSNVNKNQIEKYSANGKYIWYYRDPENFTPLGNAIDNFNNLYTVEHFYDYRSGRHENYLRTLNANGSRLDVVKIRDNGNMFFDQVNVNNYGDVDLHGWEHYGKVPYSTIERYNTFGDRQNYIADCAKSNYPCELGFFVEDSNSNVILNNFGTSQLEKYSQFGTALEVLKLNDYEFSQSNVVGIDKFDDLLLLNRTTGKLLVLEAKTGAKYNFTNYDFARYNLFPAFARLKNNNVYVLSIKNRGNSYSYYVDKFDIKGNFVKNIVTLND